MNRELMKDLVIELACIACPVMLEDGEEAVEAFTRLGMAVWETAWRECQANTIHARMRPGVLESN